MESRRLRAGLVLLLAVIALGAAGAAVDSGGSGSGSAGLGEGSGSGIGGGGDPGMQEPDSSNDPLFPGGILATIIGLMAVGGIVAAVVAIVLAILNRDWGRIGQLLRKASAYAAMAAIAAVLLFFLSQLFDFPAGGGSTGGFGGEAEGVSEAANETGVSIPPVVGVAIVVVVLVLLLVVARSRDDEEPTAAKVAPDPGDSAPPSGDSPRATAGVGRPPADNEVYRAWLSLADAAGADTRRDTPEEVADRAVEAGVDEAAAREITALFESVRYGDREVNDGVERRAERARTSLAGDR